jgi:protein-disulfide isomerase
MKVNAVVALVVGLIVGFVLGGVIGPFGKKAPPPPAKIEEPSVEEAKPTHPPKPKPPRKPPQAVQKVPVGNAPTLGPADALVTVVTFLSYQCPFCAKLDTTISQLQKEMTEKGKPFRVVMKQFPLDFQQNSRPAAMAALAAGAQGKYWEMHEVLLKNMRALDEASLKKYAQELGLDMAKFNADLENKALLAQIDADVELGSEAGVKGTPASFVNGRFVSGAWPKEDLETLIEEEMLKAQKLVEQGTPADRVYEKILESAKAVVDKSNIPIPDNAPSKGPKNAPVTVLIWSDFECPYCSKVVPTLHELEKKYPTQVRFVFRHLPLNFHKNAQKAAEAAMAAHAQGKFWEMHDLLFENQKALDVASLISYAQKLKLDMKKFQNALSNNTYADYVKNDSTAAKEYSITGTPTFTINGKEISGAQPPEAFSKIIDAALRRANRPPPAAK